MSVAIIPDFVKYQIEWLTSHNDLEFDPVTESALVRMLKDTGKSFIDEWTAETSQADHIAESGRMVERTAETAQNTSSRAHENDPISRQMALDAITDELMPSTPLSAVIRAKNRLKDLPAVQPDHIADSDKKVERTAETALKEACPVCGYKFQDCQCRFSGSAHPDRSKRATVVADHIYLLTDAQIAHLAKVQEWWQISYDDEEMDRILEELKGNEKG